MTRLRIALLFGPALLLAAVAEQVGTQAENGFDFDPSFVARSFQAFPDLVGVRWDSDHLYVESDGMPTHRMMVGIRAWNQQVPVPQSYFGDNAFRLPLRPRFAEEPVSARETLFRGAIAIAANGVPIFNPIKNDGVTDTLLAGELDEFGGHAGRADDYHYHIAPVHLAVQTGADLPVAWALDGFPIYGLTEPDGSEVVGLDWLNGHRHGEGPYHYHATEDYPRLNGGFRGRVGVRNGQVSPQPRTVGIRPFTRPLRGATITAFHRDGPGRFRLEYEINRETHSVGYQLLEDGAEFVFTDANSVERTETHVRRRGRARRAR